MHERHKIILRDKFGVQRAELLIRKIEANEEAATSNNQNREAREKVEREELLHRAIPKKELLDGEVYFGMCERLTHNETAKWNAEKQKFIVKKQEIFGLIDFEIDHIEDVIKNGFAGFVPFEILK